LLLVSGTIAGPMRAYLLLWLPFLGGACGRLGYDPLGRGADGAVPTDSSAAPAYVHRIPLRLLGNRISEQLADFPLLLTWTAHAELAQHADEPADIQVRAADGQTALASEIEEYDPATGRLAIWIRAPLLQPGVDLPMFLYFAPSLSELQPDPAPTVWSNDFLEVWHLHEVGTGAGNDVRESVSGALLGSAGGGDTARVPVRGTGRIAGAQRFDGLDDYLLLPSDPGRGAPKEGGSLSHWIALSDTSATSRVIYYETAAATSCDHDGFGIYSPCNDMEFHTAINVGGDHLYYITEEIPHYVEPVDQAYPALDMPDRWIHFAVTWTMQPTPLVVLYADGQEIARDPFTAAQWNVYQPAFRALGSPLDPTWMGDHRGWPGWIDEFRLAGQVRTAAWIATEFANQSNPSDFWSVSGVEMIPYTPATTP
jgi:hypothetical protein